VRLRRLRHGLSTCTAVETEAGPASALVAWLRRPAGESVQECALPGAPTAGFRGLQGCKVLSDALSRAQTGPQIARR